MTKRAKKEQKKEAGPPGIEHFRTDQTANTVGPVVAPTPRKVEFEEGLAVVGPETGGVVRIGLAPNKILVDRVKFSRMVKAVVQGIQGGKAYSNRAGITKFGEIMGGKNTEEYEALYRACMATVEEDNKKGK